MTTRCRLALPALALCWASAVLNGAPHLQREPSVRTMFYDPVAARESPDAAGSKAAELAPRIVLPGESPRFIGVHYWLDRVGRGRVTDATVFATGDRIRLHVRSNVDGYLAVWTFDNGRRPALLLPVGGSLGGSVIRAGSDYVSPSITFAPPVQDEVMVLFLARDRSQLPSMSAVENGARTLLESPDAKNLKVETVDVVNGEVGTYVVNDRGGPVAHQIVLHHVARGGQP